MTAAPLARMTAALTPDHRVPTSGPPARGTAIEMAVCLESGAADLYYRTKLERPTTRIRRVSAASAVPSGRYQRVSTATATDAHHAVPAPVVTSQSTASIHADPRTMKTGPMAKGSTPAAATRFAHGPGVG